MASPAKRVALSASPSPLFGLTNEGKTRECAAPIESVLDYADTFDLVQFIQVSRAWKAAVCAAPHAAIVGRQLTSLRGYFQRLLGTMTMCPTCNHPCSHLVDYDISVRVDDRLFCCWNPLVYMKAVQAENKDEICVPLLMKNANTVSRVNAIFQGCEALTNPSIRMSFSTARQLFRRCCRNVAQLLDMIDMRCVHGNREWLMIWWRQYVQMPSFFTMFGVDGCKPTKASPPCLFKWVEAPMASGQATLLNCTSFPGALHGSRFMPSCARLPPGDRQRMQSWTWTWIRTCKSCPRMARAG